MKLITRGYGNNHQIITRGYGLAAIVSDFAGGAQAILKETITLVRFNVTQFQPIKVSYHIGRFKIAPFDLNLSIIKINPTATYNLLVHHVDIRIQQFISTIRTKVHSLSIKHENVSK